MSDLAAVLLAASIWVGAVVAAPVPLAVGVLCCLSAFLTRRGGLLVVGGFALATSLSASAWDGLDRPVLSSVHGRAVVVSDPVVVAHSVRAELRVDGRRVEAWASGAAATGLRAMAAGDVVVVRGRVRAPPEGARARLAVRHVVARLDVDAITRAGDGSPAARLANAMRAVLVRGAAPLPDHRRALLTGFLVGDDRDVPAVVEADFRAAGMTHLLAVSGSNVALVLAVAAPLLRRLQLRGRLAASLALIGFFAVVTRAEPSVLRASAMAAIACWTAFAGRPVSRVRLIALAVAALVLVDPMLPRSVGFQLSVGASLGLALLAAPIAARLPGPRVLAEPLAVTAAAQLGVAPVAVAAFGGVPLVSLVTNLLAVPVAGPLTAWGFTAGFAAGVLGPPVDALVHAPTALLLAWVEGVARVGARAPVGLVDGTALLIAAAGVAIARVATRRLALVAGTVVLVLAARPPTGTIAAAEVAPGARVWRAGAVVVVLDGAPDAARLLGELRHAGVRRVDLVVATAGGRSTAGTVADLRTRIPIRAVAAPRGHRIRDATAIGRPRRVELGALVVTLTPTGGRLRADVVERTP